MQMCYLSTIMYRQHFLDRLKLIVNLRLSEYYTKSYSNPAGCNGLTLFLIWKVGVSVRV